MAADPKKLNKKLYELCGQFNCSCSDLYIRLSLSYSIHNCCLRAEIYPRYHFIYNKTEVYNNLDVQQKSKMLIYLRKCRYLSVLTIS